MNKSMMIALALVAAFAVVQANAQDQPATGYSVDFSRTQGAIRPINGINLWANMSCETITSRQEAAAVCHFSTVRLHDVPGNNDGIRLVDVQQIFANLDADPSDPNNYYFKPTDDYIQNILKVGSVPVYRLGVTIEHSVVKYFAKKPDPEKYAEICAGIVRHYNAKWADGFEWNLPYWEIWNEPDLVPQMWDDRDWNSYCQFYVVVAKRLRAEFPKIKIGGPALTGANYDKIKALAKYCKDEGAPLDFVSWHCYAKTPSQLLDTPALVRKTLDEAGFPDAELHINEWHYFPTEWNVIHGENGGPDAKRELDESPTGLHGAEATAFADLVLTRWLDTPLTMSNYYTFDTESWGLFDRYGEKRPVYYAFLFFGRFVAEAPIRVQTQDPGQNVALLGSVDGTGKTKLLLVSVYKQEFEQTIEIALKGVPESGEAVVDYVDYEHDFASEKIKYSDGKLKLDAQKSSVFFVRF